MSFVAAQVVRETNGHSLRPVTRFSEPRAAEARDSSQAGTPAPMEKSLDRREQDLVSEQTNQNNDQHHADDLIHRVQFTSVMQKMSKPEPRQNGHVNFGRHE